MRLDPEHVGEGERHSVWLRPDYIAGDVRLGYASTPDKGQGATHDHSLYAASDRSSLERGYVASAEGGPATRASPRRARRGKKLSRTAVLMSLRFNSNQAHAPEETQRPMERD